MKNIFTFIVTLSIVGCGKAPDSSCPTQPVMEYVTSRCGVDLTKTEIGFIRGYFPRYTTQNPWPGCGNSEPLKDGSYSGNVEGCTFVIFDNGQNLSKLNLF